MFGDAPADTREIRVEALDSPALLAVRQSLSRRADYVFRECHRRVTVASDEFLPGQLIADYANLAVEVECVVPAEKRIMPYIWGCGEDLDDFEEAVRSDPHVKSVVLDRLGGSALYNVEWDESAEELISGIAKSKGTILEARGDEEWTFRIRFENPVEHVSSAPPAPKSSHKNVFQGRRSGESPSAYMRSRRIRSRVES